MNCNSCGNQIDFKMKHSIKTNHCPFCGNTMLSSQQHISLVELDRVLKSESFTEDLDLDTRIKERVSLLLTKHFDFTMTSMPKEAKERSVEVKEESEPQKPKKESPLKAKLDEARALYAKVQADIDEPIDLDMPDDEDPIEIGEDIDGSFMNVFGRQSQAEKAAQYEIEAMKQKRRAQSSGSGIKRLS